VAEDPKKPAPSEDATATVVDDASIEPDARGSDVVDIARGEHRGAPVPRRRTALRTLASKGLFLAAALFLFVLAIQLMKAGAKSIAPSIEGSFLFDNGASTLGFGWMSAYVVLSGSPVAATSLALFDGEILSPLQTFTMLSGSRLGASFIVLLAGFLYALRNRGRNRGESIGMGVLAISLTAIVYVPGMLIGYWFLKSGTLSGIRWQASSEVLSIVDVVWGPVENFLKELVPGYSASASEHPELWITLPVGLALLLLSFKLLDKVLPQVIGERHADSRTAWLRKPWPMFLLGCIVATLTLSVSVALTVLVPLASKGYVQRREAIPYIMGANITTLADTLVAAMLLGNPIAVQIVLAQAIGVAIVTVFMLAFLYRPVTNGAMALDDWLVASNRRLAIFVAGLFVAPIVFLTSGLYIGPISG